MSASGNINAKIFTLPSLEKRIIFWRQMGDRVVFTNGCFDILHKGHIHLLAECALLGDRVVVGLNSDQSVSNLKGPARPINDEVSRAILLSAITYVDAVIIFSEDTPINLIETIKPDVLAKGGDWGKSKIVGSEFVESNRGQVVSIPYLEGFSTTNTIQKSKG